MTVDSVNNNIKAIKNPISRFGSKFEFYSLSPRIGRIKYFALSSFWLIACLLLVRIGERQSLSQAMIGWMVIFFILPNFLALNIRRLNDTDHSGWWLFINLIPILGNMFCLVLLYLWPGNKGLNSYGEQTKTDKCYYYGASSIALLPFVKLFALAILGALGFNY